MDRRTLLACLILAPALTRGRAAFADGPAAPPYGSEDPLLAFSPSGKSLFCADESGTASVLCVPERSSEPFTLAATSVSRLARWQPGQDLLAVPEGAGVLLVDFRTSPAKVLVRIPFPVAVTALEWSPTGDRLALGLESGIVEVRNAQTGASLCSADLSGRKDVAERDNARTYCSSFR